MLLRFADWLTYDLLRLAEGSRLGGTLSFFIYDTIKIILLLFIFISFVGVVRTYLPQEKIKDWMGRKGIAANLFASSFGALLPFCSCSSIPLFIGLVRSGIPLGVTLSFLITSPIINEYLVVLMFGFFGWKITVLYVASGLIIGTFSGALLGKMKLERYLVEDMIKVNEDGQGNNAYKTFVSRIKFALNESLMIVKRIWIWILVGVGVGALIHNYVPDEVIQSAISKTGPFSVPIAVILGVPMYGSCAAIVPVAVVLFNKGIPLGTALAFMMAVAALSLPEAVLLRRAMKVQLMLVFFSVTTIAIIITGYLFNIFQRIIL